MGRGEDRVIDLFISFLDVVSLSILNDNDILFLLLHFFHPF